MVLAPSRHICIISFMAPAFAAGSGQTLSQFQLQLSPSPMSTSQLPRLLQNSFDQLLQDWMTYQAGTVGRRLSASDENSLSANSRDFLTLFRQGVNSAEA